MHWIVAAMMIALSATALYMAHGWGGYLLIGAVVLNVVGALKHHLIDRDGTLRRILWVEVQVAPEYPDPRDGLLPTGTNA